MYDRWIVCSTDFSRGIAKDIPRVERSIAWVGNMVDLDYLYRVIIIRGNPGEPGYSQVTRIPRFLYVQIPSRALSTSPLTRRKTSLPFLFVSTYLLKKTPRNTEDTTLDSHRNNVSIRRSLKNFKLRIIAEINILSNIVVFHLSILVIFYFLRQQIYSKRGIHFEVYFF